LIRRRFLPFVLLCGLAMTTASAAFAQGPAAKDVAEEQKEFNLHLANSILFAIGFGYLLWRIAPAFFNARSADIQKAIKDATGLKIQADFRYSEIDRKMATLPQEVERMRAEARAAMEREHERIRRETDEELEHILRKVAFEADAFRKEATRRVRLHTSLLALNAAERRLRDQSDSLSSGEFVDDFIHLVEEGKTR
jgi:F-type H+-transporting ATPase subunit b